MVRVTILDGYIDEPTCLGVPPYISPYPRYIAGAVWTFEKNAQLTYLTIDQIRTDHSRTNNIEKSNLLIVIAGMAVPGRYLAGRPVSPNELDSFVSDISTPLTVLCGPVARYGFGMAGGSQVRDIRRIETLFDLIITGDPEIVIHHLLNENLNASMVDPAQCRSTPTMIRDFAINGSRIVMQHPFFPEYLITEIETYRGCPRSIVGGCSFCSEPAKGIPMFRPIKDIHDEIHALHTVGAQHFRIGNQPCIFSYMAKDAGEEEFPRPNPEAVEQLFRGIRAGAPALQTLHIDNANPGVLARYPEESLHIAKTIIQYHTPGDVAAFGVESVDPVVIKKNNLKASPDEVFHAISLLNKVGSTRGTNGLPELLPGLNFVVGLAGETKTTFQLDYAFLKQVYTAGLLLRRINLRQVLPIPGTPMFQIGTKLVKKHKHLFHSFKRRVQQDIEQPMLHRLVPEGTSLTNVYTELHDGKTTFGRQLGSYPLLVGIPGVLPLRTFTNVKVVDYGYRSITAVPFPLQINHAARETIESLPGVGKRRSLRIMAHRPFNTIDEFIQSFDDPKSGQKILDYITIE